MEFKNSAYENFEKRAAEICKNRVYKSSILRHAYSVDASCYRYIPQIVVILHSEEEAIQLLKAAKEENISLTFKAAGSSLSGQCSSDSVLVMVNDGFKNIEILEDGKIIELDVGVVASDANLALAKYGRKIGPDPATITAALIGGVVNNNSSGMCCGVSQNSYQTIHSLRAILLDGTVIDTKDEESIKKFLEEKPDLVAGLLALREEIINDEELSSMIKRKYKIKNTTGYGLNSLLDFDNFKDILNHILIGSEGTLAFISKVRFFTVEDYKYKASALLIYKDLDEGAKAVVKLAQLNEKHDNIVSAAEMMDFACLRAVKTIEDVKDIVSDLEEGSCAILIQTEANSSEALEENLKIIQEDLKDLQVLKEFYSSDEKTYTTWWKIRKGILPIVAGLRKPEETIITEDVCFKIENFVDGIKMLQKLFKKHNFPNGVIFGHALAGNLHFNITPNLNDKVEEKNFANLVKDMAIEVVRDFDGSIKAEHGTGRMVAPFIEIEWGKKAYEINRKIKKLFDPEGNLNKDVIITDDAEIYKKNLKKMPKSIFDLPPEQEVINKCMECGFCEKHCPSRNFTLTPRQRISILRDVERYISEGNKALADELLKEYEFYGEESCAACSQCLELCPLGIDTAKIAEHLRRENSHKTLKRATSIYNNLDRVNSLAKFGLNLYSFSSTILGAKNIAKTTKFLNSKMKFFPYAPEFMPKANNYKLENKNFSNEEKIVYFTACVNQMFKPNSKYKDKRALQEVVESICQKAEISVIYPQNLKKMCCGKMFVNYEDILMKNEEFLEQELLKASEDGKYKILIDHSSCFYELSKALKNPKLKVLDISEFLLEIKDKVKIQKSEDEILVHQLCLMKKMKKADKILELAQLCSNKVQVIKSLACCGFAGDKGFFLPDLNLTSSKDLKAESLKFSYGVSSSSTCEIGLSSNSAIEFQNIAYLFDKVSEKI